MSIPPTDPIARFAAADPARGLVGDDAARARLWGRILAEEPPAAELLSGPRSPRAGTRRGRPRAAMLLVPAVLVLAAGAALAAGVIRFGAPVNPAPHGFRDPRADIGVPVPGTVRVLPIATPDPEGGPPWGLRLFHTTRGLGCVQVGRVLDGRFGALGRDGAFGDDGRFHEVAVNAALIDNDCTNLDGAGHTFTNLSVFNQDANAWQGYGSCAPAGSDKMNVPPSSGTCEQSHERDLHYGLLGPDAQSITYTSGGHSVTQPTVGPEGAYLIVTHAIPNRFYDFMGASTGGVVPVSGPITAVHYRDGGTCHLTARSWIGGADACTPSLGVPVGYVSPSGVRLGSAQVATPVHVRLVGAPDGGYEMLLSFTSRVAISNARRVYQIEWHEPGMPAQVNAFSITREDIVPGQTVIKHLGRGLGRGLKPGVTRGTVSFMQSTGGEEKEEAGVPVGRFAVRVP